MQTLAWGLIQAAKRLDESSKDPGDREALLTAVRLNWKLWTIIQADILDEESLLSLEIRQSLLDLSNFIDKHTIGIIASPDVGKLPILIDINKNIAAGLFDSMRKPTDEADPASGEGDSPATNSDKISTTA